MATTQTIAKPSGADKVVGQCLSIGIAEIDVVREPDTIRTVVGSCIAIALYDQVTKIGGMAHVILPDSKKGAGDPGKFADTAIDLLRSAVLAEGAKVKNLTCKIAGGATMFGSASTPGLGSRNADAVEANLKRLNVRIAGSDLGGSKGRQITLDPATGSVLMNIIGESEREL